MSQPATTELIAVEHPLAEAWRVYRRNLFALVGLLGLLLIIITALLGPYIYTVDPFEIIWAPLTPPGEEANLPLGTDYLGRDILAGLIHGAAPTLLVGVTAALITVVIGLLVGCFAGFYGGFIDDALMRFTEFFQVLPALLFSMVILTLFGPSLPLVALAIGIISWPPTARLARAEFLKIKNFEYVMAARSIGAENSRLIWKVILPNALPPLIVSATLTIGGAILFEAALSFLGLSDPNIMSWGLMIGGSREYFIDAWWTVTFPGFAIFITVLCVSLVGDGLNDAFNPRLRER